MPVHAAMRCVFPPESVAQEQYSRGDDLMGMPLCLPRRGSTGHRLRGKTHRAAALACLMGSDQPLIGRESGVRTRSIGACLWALALTTMVLAGEQPGHASGPVSALRVSHARVMPNEYLRFRGRLPVERARVMLQVMRPHGWARIAVQQSTSTGRFAFRTRNSAP